MSWNYFLKENDGAFFCMRLARKSTTVVWRVQKFSMLLYEKLVSPCFTFHNAVWELNLYPRGKNIASRGQVSIFLRQSKSCSELFKCKVYIRDEDGQIVKSRSFGNNFQEHPVYGYASFLDRKELLKNKLGNLLPDDIFTICCEIDVETDDSSMESDVSTELSLYACDCSLTDDLRGMFEKGQLTDVVLKVGEKQFSAHKLILSSRSPVFKAMFEANMKESQENVVTLSELEPSIAKAMLNFIYSKSVHEMPLDKTLQLYAAADRYMITALQTECRNFMIRNMTVQNVGRMATIADLHSDQVLKQNIKRFFAANFKEILVTDEWKKLSRESPVFCVEFLEKVLLSNEFL